MKIVAVLIALLALGSFSAPPVGAAPVTPAPGHRIKVFLLAGQSNMEGKGDAAKFTPADQERLAAARTHVQLAYNGEPAMPLHFREASASLQKKYGTGPEVFGPEIFFGIRMGEAWPHERILLIKRAVGATSLYGRWNADWTIDGAAHMGEDTVAPLYPDFITYVRQILSAYRPDQYQICGMLWVQGEKDSNVKRFGPEPAANYGANLRSLIEHVRHATGVPDLPFLLVQVGSGQVVDAMKETARTVKNVSFIPQAKEPSSDHFFPKYPVGHYNYEGQKRIGTLLAEKYLATYASGATATAPDPTR